MAHLEVLLHSDCPVGVVCEGDPPWHVQHAVHSVASLDTVGQLMPHLCGTENRLKVLPFNSTLVFLVTFFGEYLSL